MRRSLLGLGPFLPALLVSTTTFAIGCSSGAASYEEQERRYEQCIDNETNAQAGAAAQTDVAPASKGPFAVNLVEVQPDAVAAAMREKLRSDTHASVNHSRYSTIARLRCGYLEPARSDFGADGGAASAPTENASSDPGGASEVSGTNNQIAGVDEADFVKNDNEYIYVANGESFRIIDAWPAAEAHEIAKVTVPGVAKKLFVEGNRAAVYSAVTPASTGSGYSDGYGPYYGSSSECTYGYDCTFQGDGTETVISIFDLTDRAAPVLVRTIRSSSSLIAARRIGTTVHTVLAQGSPFNAYLPSYTNVPDGATEADINAAYDALQKDNDTRIDGIEASSVLPTFEDSASGSSQRLLYQSALPDGTSLTSVMSLDLGADSSVGIASVISRAGAVFASADAIYMAVPHQQTGYGWYEGQSDNELSTIHKFGLGTSPLATHYEGSGAVKGRVLNQFAMDEKDGKLRIATTTGHLPDPSAHNTLSVMEDQGANLAVIGQLDHIAESEDIRSVRFDGDRGYVVTFKKTDPLFVFDLSDPHAPKSLAELKIPGFSTYMHMMDPTHLLTIGYDAADQGDFAFFTGLLLQIFDVSDSQNPILAHKEIIGTRGTSSEALTNHLAFNYFAPKNLLALPMTICEGGDTNGNYGTTMTFSGLMVFDTTVQNGFSLRGRVSHPTSSTGTGYENNGCYNWWTNATSEVKRSIIMDDWVFSVSERRIKVNALGDLTTDVKELDIE